MLEDPDANVRLRAISALGELGNKTAVDPLIECLKDADPHVRLSAVKTLLDFGDNSAKKPLQELADSEKDPAVCQAVEEALFMMSPRKHLVAHWSFDDAHATTAKDVSGQGNNGQILGCAAVEGKTGHALRFDQGKYVELGRPAGLPIQELPLTIMAWIKSEADRGVVVARGGASTGFLLYVMDGVAKFGIHRSAEGPGYIAAGSENVVGRWVHLAGVVDSDRINLYVDGKLAATTKTPGYIPNNCGQGMEIGFDVANSAAEITDNFQGIIDEVKVFNAVLSEEDIAEESREE